MGVPRLTTRPRPTSVPRLPGAGNGRPPCRRPGRPIRSQRLRSRPTQPRARLWGSPRYGVGGRHHALGAEAAAGHDAGYNSRAIRLGSLHSRALEHLRARCRQRLTESEGEVGVGDHGPAHHTGRSLTSVQPTVVRPNSRHRNSNCPAPQCGVQRFGCAVRSEQRGDPCVDQVGSGLGQRRVELLGEFFARGGDGCGHTEPLCDLGEVHVGTG